MIGRELLRGGSFWSFLLSIDKDLAECTRKKACSCGGRLHCANYPRSLSELRGTPTSLCGLPLGLGFCRRFRVDGFPAE
jgi:hypothetical protein